MIDRNISRLYENIDKNDMFVHYESSSNLSESEEKTKKQNKIDNMINIFNKQLEWDNTRIKAYFDAIDFIVKGTILSAKEKIENASKKGFFETNLLEFDRNTVISPNNDHNVKLLGMIYHTKYNDFYSDNGLPYLIDFVSDLLAPYDIIFWKPKKNLWVIQAKWDKVLKNKLSDDIDYESDSSYESEYICDEKNSQNEENNHNDFSNYIDYKITGDIVYSNNNLNNTLPILDYGTNSLNLNILPSISEYKKNI